MTSKVEGNGTTVGVVETFEPTTTSCLGTGVFTGCELVADQSNAPFTATTTAAGDIVLTDDEPGNITILNGYNNCLFGVLGSHLELAEVTATPTVSGSNPHNVDTLHVHGLTANGSAITSGILHKEEATSALKLKTTP